MRAGRPRTAIGIVLALLTLLLATGCVVVPASGPVEKIAGQPPQCTNCVNVKVEPPELGDSPKEIVEGYLRANSNFQPSYAVARQFLTDAAAERWSPEAGAQIYEGDAKGTGSQVRLSGQLVGRLGPDRTYTPADQKLEVDFGLIEERPGQWRIDRPPSGLLVADYAFALYQPYNLYFIGNGRALVPNRIYLPNIGNQAGLASVLMGALIVGPSNWLKPAVGTALPGDAALSGDAVTITDGIAEVPLNSVVSSLNESQRSLLAAQVVYTLGQPVVGIAGVRFTVDGQPFRVPGGDPDTFVVTPEVNFPDLNPVPTVTNDQLYAMRDRGVELLNASSDVPDAKPMPGPLGSGEIDVESLAVQASGTDLVAVTDGGTVLQMGSTVANDPGTRVLGGVRGLLRPQYSRFGEIWAVGDRNGRQRFWVTGGGKQLEVAPVLPAGTRILAFRVSPDASRLAVVLSARGQTQLGLMRIVRSETVTVDGWRALDLDRTSTADLTRFADVNWADATTLVSLAGPRGTTPLAPYRITEDAFEAGPEGEANNWDAVAITVSLRSQAAIVLSRDGQTWRDGGTQWVEYLDKVRAITYPG